MRSFSDSFLLLIPGLVALVLLAFFAVPMRAGGWPLAPNVGLVMTLVAVTTYPAAWPRWFAFLFGLLQDVVFSTPLGSQALLLVLLVGITEHLARRQSSPPFRMRWLEAAGIVIVWHLFLWALGHFVTPDFAPLGQLLRAGITSALWYPLFYFAMTRWTVLT